MGQLFSPGKLMLTSEYVALDGALVLAVPTKPGQELFYNKISGRENYVKWQACHRGELWLDAALDYKSNTVLSANLPEAAEFLLNIFKNIRILGGQDLFAGQSYHFKTNLQFPADYGLGSSATLMANLAEWAGVDAFALNGLCFGGSGYDVAVAKEKSAVLYCVKDAGREVEKINYRPVFAEDLIFVHLNRKQDSREGIRLYRSLGKPAALIEEFSEITKNIVKSENLQEFSALMRLHEQRLAAFLGLETAEQRYFVGCPAFVKSLGAWGGDFVMSAKFPGYRSFFSERGFPTVIGWEDLIH